MGISSPERVQVSTRVNYFSVDCDTTPALIVSFRSNRVYLSITNLNPFEVAVCPGVFKVANEGIIIDPLANQLEIKMGDSAGLVCQEWHSQSSALGRLFVVEVWIE